MSVALPVVESSRLRRVLLVGNPNAGKTSLFNALTGLRGQTANFPGITVDLRKGRVCLPLAARPSTFGESPSGIKDGIRPVGGASGAPASDRQEIELIDLPGLYGLEPTSPEEKVAAASIRSGAGDPETLFVLVLDSTNLSRNLFLAEEVLQTGVRCVIALNMIDAADAMKIRVDALELSRQLDCPVVPVSARDGSGLDELLVCIGESLSSVTPDVSPRISCTSGCRGCGFAARHDWADAVCGSVVRGQVPRSRSVRRLDAWLTSPGFGTACLGTVMLSVFFVIFSLADLPMSLIEGGFAVLGDRVADWLPERRPTAWLWFPFSVSLSALLLGGALTLGGYRLSRLKWTAVIAASLLIASLPMDDFRSLLIDGVIGGVAGVVVFLPQICILFFFIAVLEDTGYMARAAFVMERWMRYVGLPGKAFVPMLSAHACAIPGIMATRTIENWRDRLVTMLVLPLLTCSARLPVYAMMSTLLFAGRPAYAALTFAAAYVLGLSAALGSAFVLKKTILPGEAAPLVLELPPYRLPSMRNACLAALDRATAFLRTAGSVILLISVCLWAMATYPKLPEDVPGSIGSGSIGSVAVAEPSDFEAVGSGESADGESADGDTGDGGAGEARNARAQSALEYSLVGRLGKSIEPVFRPLGFDWKINVGVMTSFAAREVLVSALSVIYGVGEDGAEDNRRLVERLRRQKRPDGTPVFNVATNVSLLVFFVLAMQCLPTQVVTRRESGAWKWAVLQFVFMTLLAYVAALVAYQSLAAAGFAVA